MFGGHALGADVKLVSVGFHLLHSQAKDVFALVVAVSRGGVEEVDALVPGVLQQLGVGLLVFFGVELHAAKAHGGNF